MITVSENDIYSQFFAFYLVSIVKKVMRLATQWWP